MRNVALIALQFALIAFLASFNPQARSESEPRKTPPIAPRDNLLDPEPPCSRWVTNGAMDGESLDARIERLDVALRLSKAERYVNRRRK